MTTSIAIVGAGVLGRVLAWQWLQRCGADIQIDLYNDTPLAQAGAASFTAAGMLTPYCELADADTLIFELGLEGLSRWANLAEQLAAVTPQAMSLGLQQHGSLVVAHAADDGYYQQFQQQVRRKLGRTEAVTELNRDQLNAQDPELTERFNKALYIKNEAWLNSQDTMAALAQALQQHSQLRFIQAKVHEAINHTVSTEHGTQPYDIVYDCRGLGAKTDVKRLRGVRGELIWLHAPEVNIKHLLRLMHPRYRLYLVPRGNHTYLVGASQLESEQTGPITVRSSLELLSAVYSIHSGFAEAQVLRTDTNLRPAFDDNQPKIICQDGVIRVNGLFRHGYLLTPTIADMAFHAGLQQPQPNPLSSRVIQEATHEKLGH